MKHHSFSELLLTKFIKKS